MKASDVVLLVVAAAAFYGVLVLVRRQGGVGALIRTAGAAVNDPAASDDWALYAGGLE